MEGRKAGREEKRVILQIIFDTEGTVANVEQLNGDMQEARYGDGQRTC